MRDEIQKEGNIDLQSRSIKSHSSPQIVNEQEKKPKKSYHYMSMMINPALIEDPLNENENVSRDIFYEKGIREIRRYTEYLHLSIFQRKKIKRQSEQIAQNLHFSSSELQNQFDRISKEFKANIEAYKAILAPHILTIFSKYQEIVKSNLDKPFMSWYLPMRDISPKMKGITFSKKLLNIIGYEMDEAPTEVDKYREFAFDFLDGKNYKEVYLNFLSTFQKFVSLEVKGSPKKEDIIKESTKMIQNTIKGKKQVKLLMQISMPEPFILIFEAIEVINTTEKENHRLEKRQKIEKCQANAYHTLHNISKLPNSIDPIFASKVCDYKIIMDENINYQYVDTLKNGDYRVCKKLGFNAITKTQGRRQVIKQQSETALVRGEETGFLS